MEKLFILAQSCRPFARPLRVAVTLCLSLALASIFWVASVPIAQAAHVTPAEIIQSKLSPNETITNASNTHLLQAVYKAVKQSPKDAGLIVTTAAGARKPLRSDLLCMAVQAQKEKHSLNCTWVANILREWVKADPDNANHLIESAAQCATDCGETLQMNPSGEEGNFVAPPSNTNQLLVSFGSGGSASENVCMVCNNGKDMRIGCPGVDSFLKTHPGATRGSCQITPTTNL
jgi:hypothetical protein